MKNQSQNADSNKKEITNTPVSSGEFWSKKLLHMHSF